jgi:hypothetical protein
MSCSQETIRPCTAVVAHALPPKRNHPHGEPPARRSARTQADAEHVKAKTEFLKLRLLEKRRNLVLRDELDALIDGMAGMVLTKLQGCPHVWLAPILPNTAVGRMAFRHNPDTASRRSWSSFHRLETVKRNRLVGRKIGSAPQRTTRPRCGNGRTGRSIRSIR